MADPDICDVLVVGGGLAGLCAALRAAELGMRAAVLEQGQGDRYPCNSRSTGGIFHLAFQEMKRPPEELERGILAATDGAIHPALAKALAADAARLIDWLRGHGAKFMSGGQSPWERWLLAPPRPFRSGLIWQGLGPDLLLRTLGAHLVARGGSIHDGTRAVALHPQQQGFVVDATKAGEPVRFGARAVVIADGGFQADPELYRRHIAPHPERLKQRGAGTGRGDGTRMASAMGAALTNMRRFYGHLLAREAMSVESLWPYPQLDPVATAGIIVDAAGRRVCDEGMGGVALANALAHLDDPLGTTVVFDVAIWEGPARTTRIPVNPNLELGGGTVHRADTLAGLARHVGIDAAALERTVAEYNAARAAGRLGDLVPSRRADLYAPWAIEKPPFMAVQLCAGITYTMGGIVIDEHARVLRPDGTAIAGLYAAGSATGGIEGGGSGGGYVGGLSKAGIFGLRAAEHIAAGLHC